MISLIPLLTCKSNVWLLYSLNMFRNRLWILRHHLFLVYMYIAFTMPILYSYRYALLIGRPPFETSTLKETYVRITSNNYSIPNTLSQSAKSFIQKCLRHEPDRRPCVDELLLDEFITTGLMPKSLPTTCCTNAPKYPVYTKLPR